MIFFLLLFEWVIKINSGIFILSATYFINHVMIMGFFSAFTMFPDKLIVKKKKIFFFFLIVPISRNYIYIYIRKILRVGLTTNRTQIPFDTPVMSRVNRFRNNGQGRQLFRMGLYAGGTSECWLKCLHFVETIGNAE